MLMWLIDEAVARGYSDEIVTFFLMDTVGAAVFNTAAVSLKLSFVAL